MESRWANEQVGNVWRAIPWFLPFRKLGVKCFIGRKWPARPALTDGMMNLRRPKRPAAKRLTNCEWFTDNIQTSLRSKFSAISKCASCVLGFSRLRGRSRLRRTRDDLIVFVVRRTFTAAETANARNAFGSFVPFAQRAVVTMRVSGCDEWDEDSLPANGEDVRELR